MKKKIKGHMITAVGLSLAISAVPVMTPLAETKPFVFIDEDASEEDVPDEDVYDEEDDEKNDSGNSKKKVNPENDGILSLTGLSSEKLFRNYSAKSRYTASPGEITRKASASEMMPMLFSMSAYQTSSLGDIWSDWNGDFSFLDGSHGIGTKEKPYQIRTKNQLMGLSQLAIMGMNLGPGDTGAGIIGDYSDAWFELASNIDLGGMRWIPIGYYSDSSEFAGDVLHPFTAHFNGNGKTVSNFTFEEDWPNVGLFGATEGAEIINLKVAPEQTVRGSGNVGILAGSMYETKVKDVTVTGDVESDANAGGVAGIAEYGIIEDLTAHVTVNATGDAVPCAGGITGRANAMKLVDVTVSTGNNSTTRIQGREAYVGGITGVQNDTDIYNSFVSGTVGGSNSLYVGGITGKYISGKLKVSRFEGTIGQSGSGLRGRRGTFIGFRDAGDWFNYGEDVSYLFTDSETKIMNGVCGSEIPDDNMYKYEDMIGFSHSNDLHTTIIQNGLTKELTDKYFYEVLEEGILKILDEDLDGSYYDEPGFTLDHFAPGDSGRPVRGYLVTIPQIDTVSAGLNYYDVAVMEARGGNTYYRTMDKEHRASVEAGKKVTISTAPNNTEDAKFQLEGKPWFMKNGRKAQADYAGEDSYSFIMPAENTMVSADYKKVAVKVSVIPTEYHISVVQERTGDRKHPTIVTRVTGDDGKLIATFINGELEKGTVVQPIRIQSVVDTENDVEDASVRWSVDDSELIRLLKNEDENEAGYTRKSAAIELNLESSFFRDTIMKLEKEQADSGFRYKIPDTIFGAGHQSGGVAILTAETKPAASFEEKPCRANARINVTFQVKDKTYLGCDEVKLTKQNMDFTVTRTLTGSRLNPKETITVTAPQSIRAYFEPDYSDRKIVGWKTSDATVASVDGEQGNASVSAVADGRWIRDCIKTDEGIHKADVYAKLNGHAENKAVVTVITEDMLGGRAESSCDVNVKFVTADETFIPVDGIKISPEAATIDFRMKRTGYKNNPEISYEGTMEGRVKAAVTPVLATNKGYKLQCADDSLVLKADGSFAVNMGSSFVKGLDDVKSGAKSHKTTVQAISDDGGFVSVCNVLLNCTVVDETRSYSSGDSGGSSGGGGGGSVKKPVTSVSPAIPAGSAAGEWKMDEKGSWRFSAHGHEYKDEWAYVYNPYAAPGSEQADWFFFGPDGVMVTGWHLDRDGHMYYLSEASDGRKGHMVIGEAMVPDMNGVLRKCTFNTVSDGTRGALLKME